MVAGLGFATAAIGVLVVGNESPYPAATEPFVDRFPHWYVIALAVLGGPPVKDTIAHPRKRPVPSSSRPYSIGFPPPDQKRGARI